jgi:hypothetical protein
MSKGEWRDTCHRTLNGINIGDKPTRTASGASTTTRHR